MTREISSGRCGLLAAALALGLLGVPALPAAADTTVIGADVG
jgi:hypothetical protein